MYDKGQLVLNTLRHVVNDDSLWFSTIRALATRFRYQTITAEDVFGLINEMTDQDLTSFFDQYFRHATIPALQVSVTSKGIPRPSGTAGWPRRTALPCRSMWLSVSEGW